MLKFIAKLFGTKSEKDIKRVMPLVEESKQEGEKLKNISHDELRNETRKVQQTINDHLKDIDAQLAGLHQQINDNPNLEIDQKEGLFQEIDKLEADRNKELEKVLLTVLPKTFAIVRETARRFKENEFQEIKAQAFYIPFASTNENEKINAHKAVSANQCIEA